MGHESFDTPLVDVGSVSPPLELELSLVTGRSMECGGSDAGYLPSLG